MMKVAAGWTLSHSWRHRPAADDLIALSEEMGLYE